MNGLKRVWPPRHGDLDLCMQSAQVAWVEGRKRTIVYPATVFCISCVNIAGHMEVAMCILVYRNNTLVPMPFNDSFENPIVLTLR